MSETPLLADLLVVELASVLAGPSVGMFLAELGARVIKIEHPHGGDVTRSWRLPAEPPEEDRSAYFCAVNWGKVSLPLDLKQPAGQEVVARLIARADVVISSFRPGSAAALGLDAERLRRLHPRLIVAEVSGYGPDEARPAFDAIIQAEAGYTAMNGEPDHIAKMPVALMDVLAAHQLKEALLLALLRRERGGEGSHLQVSLLASGLSALVNQATNYLVAGHEPGPVGSDHPNIVPYGTLFETAGGGSLVLAVGNDVQFAALCRVLGLAIPEAYATNPQRVQAREAVKAWLAPAIRRWPRDPLLQALKSAGVPAGAVYRMGEAMALPQALDLRLQAGSRQGLRHLAATGEGLPRLDLRPPPHLGEGGAAVLRELGYGTAEIDRLRASGITG
ncbi:MAG: CoA transferase [Bacteroidetes bacterium]|nr:MAG: CoA transferase [Bacteroidota bacterium]